MCVLSLEMFPTICLPSHGPFTSRELNNTNNQITHQLITMPQLSSTCNDKGNEITYLQAEIQQLEGYLSSLRNRSQQKLENESYI
jgi:hypothetical protein